jgi:hypothetical protein
MRSGNGRRRECALTPMAYPIEQPSPNVAWVLKMLRRRKMIGQIFSMRRRKRAITQWRQTYPAKFSNLLLGPTSTLLGILTVWNSAEPSIPGQAANCQNEPCLSQFPGDS